MHIRTQMVRAQETGVPQLLGKDEQGREVYIEPPGIEPLGMGGMGGFRGMGGMEGGGGFGGYAGGRGYGVNPYDQGVYANPNAKFIRPPPQPYGRPFGGGYGGGYGLPLAYGLGGGLLLGGLLF